MSRTVLSVRLGVAILLTILAPVARATAETSGAPVVRTEDGFSGPASFNGAEATSPASATLDYCSEVCDSSVSCARQCWSDPETRVTCGYVGNCSTACATLCGPGVSCSTQCVRESGQGNGTCAQSGYQCGCVADWQIQAGDVVNVAFMTASVDWDNSRTYCKAWVPRRFKRTDQNNCPDNNPEVGCSIGADGTWFEGWYTGLMNEYGCCASAGYTWGTTCFPPSGSPAPAICSELW